jgi:hypothetical protein
MTYADEHQEHNEHNEHNEHQDHEHNQDDDEPQHSHFPRIPTPLHHGPTAPEACTHARAHVHMGPSGVGNPTPLGPIRKTQAS